VSRSEISSLCDFVPHNPFSDEYPRAECRVLDTGWRIAGGIILERARLEVVKSLPPQTPEALAISESSSHQGEMPMEITAAQPTEIQIPAVTTPPMCSGIAIEHQVAVDSGEGSPESTAQHQEETAAATIIAAGQSPTEEASPTPSVAPDITPDSSVQVAAKEDTRSVLHLRTEEEVREEEVAIATDSGNAECEHSVHGETAAMRGDTPFKPSDADQRAFWKALEEKSDWKNGLTTTKKQRLQSIIEAMFTGKSLKDVAAFLRIEKRADKDCQAKYLRKDMQGWQRDTYKRILDAITDSDMRDFFEREWSRLLAEDTE